MQFCQCRCASSIGNFYSELQSGVTSCILGLSRVQCSASGALPRVLLKLLFHVQHIAQHPIQCSAPLSCSSSCAASSILLNRQRHLQHAPQRPASSAAASALCSGSSASIVLCSYQRHLLLCSVYRPLYLAASCPAFSAASSERTGSSVNAKNRCSIFSSV